MKLSDFDYILPKELIAQYPLKQRDHSRLLVLSRKTGSINHTVFKDISACFRAGDLLVLNDTKVEKSRLIGSRLTGGKAEVLLLNNKGGLTFEALIKPGRVKLNEKLIFNGGSVSCAVTGKNEVAFFARDREEIYNLGVMPLPPYIKRQAEDSDDLDYQTVYANNPGAVASPTAGLHFTDTLLEKIRENGIEIVFVTLHVGHATFKPVKCEDVAKHSMEYEDFEITPGTYEKIKKAKAEKRRVIAVGTTSARVLETLDYRQDKGHICAKTNLFIYPGYKFKNVGALITNFHLPRTTLLMLVSAFAGKENIDTAYQEAIKEKYRFYSYGDAMLIL